MPETLLNVEESVALMNALPALATDALTEIPYKTSCAVVVITSPVTAVTIPNNLGWFDRREANPLPVHSLNQSQELGVIELDPAVSDARPAELRLFQPLGVEANAGAIPPYNARPVCSFCPEDL